MRRRKLLAVIVIIAALFALKALFPETVDKLKEKGRSVFSRDIDYVEVFRDMGDAVPSFLRKKATDESMQPGTPVWEELASLPERAGLSAGELISEIAVSAGEDPLEPENIRPPAVAAFIKSQEQYSGVELPENVSYEYKSLPFENSLPVIGYNSSGFGYRTHPIHGDLRFHYGTDFAAWTGEDIYAFADGSVSFAGWSDSYGNYITVDHEDGWQSLYAHCSILYVKTGDEVKAGDKIALVGDTGVVTGPHLHFELMHRGVYTNPEYYVNG